LKVIRRILLGLLWVIILTALSTGLSISSYATKFFDEPADAAIILGAAIWEDKPSPVFKARIDHGINLYKQGRICYLVFTGGTGPENIMSEAEAAKNYALGQGIASQNILIETTSKITYENLVEAKKLLDKHQLNKVLIVSDPLHMKRAMKMAHDLNLRAMSSPTPTSLYKSKRKKFSFLIREMYFYIGYIVLG